MQYPDDWIEQARRAVLREPLEQVAHGPGWRVDDEIVKQRLQQFDAARERQRLSSELRRAHYSRRKAER